ncbi:DAK2 domain-containing protein [Spiroplasma endosymbiont of Labia minor]|uniref:DAK2 domain-containing protein n=1 Tax=Spiroplasma endosymbiont of Labia minor TaxID=3066305 RepID=UPI0030D1A186
MENIKILTSMINSGANLLYNNYPHIDKLNVFPVPDGDTGTNMNLTITNGINSLLETNSTSIGDLMQKFARGLIMGARGNSGVIFSQIIKGFSKGLTDAEELSVVNWKKALNEGKQIAYAAVMKPVEGTILTVIRETADQANQLPNDTPIKEFWNKIIEFANISLENTPNLLQALKDVGVVDSGGFGLVKFLEGMNNYIQHGKVIPKTKKLETNEGQNIEMNIEDGEFGYCTEAIVMLMSEWIDKLDVNITKQTFESYGNTSIVAVKDDDILKIHTHALTPGQILTYLQQFGDFKTIKIENMSLQADKQVKGGNPGIKTQHSQIHSERKLVNNMALIGVTSSKAMQEYFKNELNFDYVIDGGSKMNPSTSDFLKAIEYVDAKTVFIFPNNSNVILAAKQAKDLEKKSRVIVIPSKTIPQGMTSMLAYDPSETFKKNESIMNRALKNVISLSISTASKDSETDGIKIKEGQYIAIVDKKITLATKKMMDIFEKSLGKLITSKTEIVTIFIGESASVQDVNDLRKFIDENFDIEYEMVESGQKIYEFIIGIE